MKRGVTPLWQAGDVIATGRTWPSLSLRRPTLRVVVAEQNSTLAAAVAHLVGVAFRTPIIAQSIACRIRVEVVGDYLVDTSLMAEAMGESFAAEPMPRFVAGDDIVAIATLTGLCAEALSSTFVEESGAPIVCLARMDGLVLPSGLPPSLAEVSCTRDEISEIDVNSELSIAEIADRCFAFTTIVANELTS